MLLLAGEMRIDRPQRDQLIGTAIEVMQETREQAGCIYFVLSADLEDPGVFHMFQEWESHEAQSALSGRRATRTSRPIATSRKRVASNPAASASSSRRTSSGRARCGSSKHGNRTRRWRPTSTAHT